MTLRDTTLERLQTTTFDVLIVGGGINGAVSAACLAAWGAEVGLIDRSDFGGLTSQQSSNLIWGGIKYLETYEFGLVRKLCASRNRLLRAYPSVVQEVRFYTAHAAGFRHGLGKLFLGTLLYWALGGFFTQPPRLLSPSRIGDEEPVVDLRGSDGGFEYSDAYLYDNDARFVWNFVRSALDHGAAAANYVESLGAARGDDGLWALRLRDRTTGREWVTKARVLVNACGPFVDDHNQRSGQGSGHHHVFSKGVHLIVPRITQSRRVLTFFADDGRPFFVIPMGPRTCIGTTDTRVTGPDTRVSPEDRRFVLDNINKRLRLPTPLTEADVVAERCGVRPLAVGGDTGDTIDWLKLSRKHVVEVDAARAHVSIFGGKLTDCLNVAEEVAAAARSLGVPLPGRGRRWYGEPGRETREAFFLRAARIGLDALTPKTALEPLSRRLWRRYNIAAFAMLDDVLGDRRMAETLVEGTDYVRCEIEHMARREMVTKLDDFLRRRSKVALVIRHEELRTSPGLREACRIFFGDQAGERAREYFATADAYAPPAPAAEVAPPALEPAAVGLHEPPPASAGAAYRTGPRPRRASSSDRNRPAPRGVGPPMRRSPASALASLVLPLCLLAACGDDQDPSGARELYQRIQDENYRAWRRAPGYETRRKAQAPHADEVDIYVNDVVAAALDAGEPLEAWPEGSLVVKDGFDGDDHELVAVMEKRKDGWFWAEYFGGDDAKYSGRPDLCVDCHDRGGNDFVRAFTLPR